MDSRKEILATSDADSRLTGMAPWARSPRHQGPAIVGLVDCVNAKTGGDSGA